MPKAIRKKCLKCGNMYGCHKGTPGDLGAKCPDCVAKDMMYYPGGTINFPAPEPLSSGKKEEKKITIKTTGEATIIIE